MDETISICLFGKHDAGGCVERAPIRETHMRRERRIYLSSFLSFTLFFIFGLNRFARRKWLFRRTDESKCRNMNRNARYIFLFVRG